MLRIIKYLPLLLLFLVGAAFLHYTLPQRDIVQIVGTDVKRMDLGDGAFFWASADAGTVTDGKRDVRFVNATDQNGNAMVYRNEDTGWSWPPYFKFDSGDINATAQAMAKQDGEAWAVVHHYGWRSRLWSIFPNVTKIRPIAGPEVSLFPWFNLIILGLLALILFMIWRFCCRIKERLFGRSKDAA